MESNIQREIKQQTDILLARNVSKTLSMQDIANHKKFMQSIVARLAHRKQTLLKRHKIVMALLQQQNITDKRRSELVREVEKIMLFEKNFNEDVMYYNNQIQAFESSPAYLKTVHHVTNDWMDLNGQFMKKEELEQAEEQEISFADLLEQEKKHITERMHQQQQQQQQQQQKKKKPKK